MICSIHNCDRHAVHKKAGLCNPCYHALWYWGKKTPTEVMQRKKKLQMFQSRLQVVQPNVNVLRLKEKVRVR
jgi:hypothetical protein